MRSPHFEALLTPYLNLSRKPRLAVAVSGGADSMGLVLLAAELAKAKRLQLVAITVDHGLRKEATKEAAKVGEWLKAHGIKHQTLTYKGLAPESNIQEFARELRYRLMAEYCKANKIANLLVAHTMEDQVETLLMRLERGSGIDGLSAIPAVQEMAGITLIRPLLSVPKASLQDYLKSRKQKWISDPSNTNTQFARVRVRNLMNEHADALFTKRMFDTAVNAGRARHALEVQVNALIAACTNLNPAGFITIDSNLLLKAPEEIALRLLSAALMCISGSEEKPRFEKLQRLYAGLHQSTVALTLHGCTLLKGGNTITVLREPARAASMKETLAAGAEVVWDGRFTLSLKGRTLTSLTVKAPTANDLAALRKKHKSSLPREVLLSAPALYRGDALVALPLIGYFETPVLRRAVKVAHTPRSALVCTPFRYCVHAANTLV
ncbi:MAG: tRNA lysidine(34) synthetase TilS [Proteobacteria bacterium]|nr:tRNA lysidine(34) synthetase TilS [Pseudomonadota bacterium]